MWIGVALIDGWRDGGAGHWIDIRPITADRIDVITSHECLTFPCQRRPWRLVLYCAHHRSTTGTPGNLSIVPDQYVSHSVIYSDILLRYPTVHVTIYISPLFAPLSLHSLLKA